MLYEKSLSLEVIIYRFLLSKGLNTGRVKAAAGLSYGIEAGSQMIHLLISPVLEWQKMYIT